MNTEQVDQILWKFLTWTDFNAMNGGFATDQGVVRNTSPFRRSAEKISLTSSKSRIQVKGRPGPPRD